MFEINMAFIVLLYAVIVKKKQIIRTSIFLSLLNVVIYSIQIYQMYQMIVVMSNSGAVFASMPSLLDGSGFSSYHFFLKSKYKKIRIIFRKGDNVYATNY